MIVLKLLCSCLSALCRSAHPNADANANYSNDKDEDNDASCVELFHLAWLWLYWYLDVLVLKHERDVHRAVLVGQGVDVGAGFLNFFQECCLFEEVAGGLLESSIFNFLDDYLVPVSLPCSSKMRVTDFDRYMLSESEDMLPVPES